MHGIADWNETDSIACKKQEGVYNAGQTFCGRVSKAKRPCHRCFKPSQCMFVHSM